MSEELEKYIREEIYPKQVVILLKHKIAISTIKDVTGLSDNEILKIAKNNNLKVNATEE